MLVMSEFLCKSLVSNYSNKWKETLLLGSRDSLPAKSFLLNFVNICLYLYLFELERLGLMIMDFIQHVISQRF